MSANGVTFRCLLTGISKNEGLKRLNNLVTHDRGGIANVNIQFDLKYV